MAKVTIRPPDNTRLLLNWLHEFDFVMPILYKDFIGKRLIITIFAQDFINLVDRAGLAPIMFCTRCGCKNTPQHVNIVKNGYTSSGNQRWKCKLCGKKLTTIKVNS